MARDSSLSRVLGAVEPLPGVVVCDVRDLPAKEAVDLFLRRDPAWRAFTISAIDRPFSCWSEAEYPRACGCTNGKACHRAHARAAKWWPEWQRRTDKRIWRAERPPGPPSLLGTQGEPRATRAEAETDARADGWPFVVLRNGHHDELERYEVPRGA